MKDDRPNGPPEGAGLVVAAAIGLLFWLICFVLVFLE